MLLNRLEYLMMNTPLRAAVQRYFEAPRLLRTGGPASGARVLELGCGRGVGAELALTLFGAASVDGFDLDPRMVALARKRLAKRTGRARVWVGDATAIAAPDASYDAVIDFGIIHHVPRWRLVLAEIRRVLKPGGRLYAEEVLRSAVTHPIVARFLAHPQEDRFDHAQFLSALAETGLNPIASERLGRGLAWFVADKPPQPH